MITTAPLTILADDREKAPFTFDGLGEVYVVRQRLLTGDYSLPFLSDKVAVSRKSLLDYYQTMFTDSRRALFFEELRRMRGMSCAAVAIEEDPQKAAPPAQFLDRHAGFVRNWFGHQQRSYAGIRWIVCDGRRDAEVKTFAFLLAAFETTQRSAG